MGVADVATSDSHIEVVHHMSKFYIFIIPLDIYCFLSCRQLQNVIVLTFSMFLCILAACYCSDYCSDSSMLAF